MADDFDKGEFENDDFENEYSGHGEFENSGGGPLGDETLGDENGDGDPVQIPNDEFASNSSNFEPGNSRDGGILGDEDEAPPKAQPGGFVKPTDPGTTAGPTAANQRKSAGKRKLLIGVGAVSVAGAIAVVGYLYNLENPFNLFGKQGEKKPPIVIADPSSRVPAVFTNESIAKAVMSNDPKDLELQLAEVSQKLKDSSAMSSQEKAKLEAHEFMLKRRMEKLQPAAPNPGQAAGKSSTSWKHRRKLDSTVQLQTQVFPSTPLVFHIGQIVIPTTNFASAVMGRLPTENQLPSSEQMKAKLSDPKLIDNLLKGNDLEIVQRVDYGIAAANEFLKSNEFVYAAEVCRYSLRLLELLPQSVDVHLQQLRAEQVRELTSVVAEIEAQLAVATKRTEEQLAQNAKDVADQSTALKALDEKVTQADWGVLETYWQALAAELQQQIATNLATQAEAHATAAEQVAMNAQTEAASAKDAAAKAGEASLANSKQILESRRLALVKLDALQKQLVLRVETLGKSLPKPVDPANPPTPDDPANPPMNKALNDWRAELTAVGERLAIQIADVKNLALAEPVLPSEDDKTKLKDAEEKLEGDVAKLIEISLNLPASGGNGSSPTVVPDIDLLAELRKQVAEDPQGRGILAQWLLGKEVLKVANQEAVPEEGDAPAVMEGLLTRWLTQQIQGEGGKLSFLAKVKSIPVDENGVALGNAPANGTNVTQADFDKWLQAYIAKNKNADPKNLLAQAAWLKNQTTKPGIIYCWLEKILLDLSVPSKDQSELTKLLNVQVTKILRAHRMDPKGSLYDLNNLPTRVTGLEKLPPRITALEKLPPRLTELEKVPPRLIELEKLPVRIAEVEKLPARVKALADTDVATSKSVAEVMTRVEKLESVTTPVPHTHPEYEAKIQLMSEQFAALEQKFNEHLKNHPPATIDPGASPEMIEWLKKNGYPPLPPVNTPPALIDNLVDGPVGSAHECFRRGCDAYFSKSPNSERQAAVQLARAIQFEPEDAMYRYFYGLSLRKCGRIDEAIEHVRYAAQLERKKGATDYFVRLERVQSEPRQWLERVRHTVLPESN